jgi:hypothetical protein
VHELREKLEAKARGDLPTADLEVLSAANSDVYELVESLPEMGIARLAVWNAFVLQSLGDKLLATAPFHGYAPADTAVYVRVLYQLASAWLERERMASANPDYDLDVRLPQDLPHHWESELRTVEQLRGMKSTFEAVQAHVGTAVQARSADALDDRVRSLMASVDAAAANVDALWVRDPDSQVRAILGASLQEGLDRAYVLGQLLAVPELLATLPEKAAPLSSVTSATTLRVLMPGDPGFEPWCLTDPLERANRQTNADDTASLDALWRTDPNPAQTLAIQADITAAIDRGAVDYYPDEGIGDLVRLASRCPWPGVLYARSTALIGGKQVDPGDRFVFTIGSSGQTFQRAIVKIPARATAAFPDAPTAETDFKTLLTAFASAGLPVYQDFALAGVT